MHAISRDAPALYITAVAKDRLSVFQTNTIKVIACKAFDEARPSGGFAIYAYVLMPDHFHAITDSFLKPSKVIQYLNGIISRRVIDHLKERGHNASLQKLQRESGTRGHRYSLWDHHSNVLPIFSEDMFMQKVNYIHRNPLRADLWKKLKTIFGRVLESGSVVRLKMNP